MALPGVIQMFEGTVMLVVEFVDIHVHVVLILYVGRMYKLWDYCGFHQDFKGKAEWPDIACCRERASIVISLYKAEGNLEKGSSPLEIQESRATRNASLRIP